MAHCGVAVGAREGCYRGEQGGGEACLLGEGRKYLAAWVGA